MSTTNLFDSWFASQGEENLADSSNEEIDYNKSKMETEQEPDFDNMTTEEIEEYARNCGVDIEKCHENLNNMLEERGLSKIDYKTTQKQSPKPKPKKLETLPLIYYDTRINSNGELKTISWEEIVKYNFNLGFNEFFGLKNPSLKRISNDVHLYYDFDSIKSQEELTSVLGWLDQLKETFGNYSVGGYTDNENILKNLA